MRASKELISCIVLLPLLASCKKDPTQRPGGGESNRGTGSVDATAWGECLGKDPRQADPGGQGPTLLGVGFHHPITKHFLTVDRFLPETAMQGTEKVQSIAIANNEMTGKIDRNGTIVELRGADWKGTTIEGVFVCPVDRSRVVHVKATIANVVASDEQQQNAVAPSTVNTIRHGASSPWLYDLRLDLPDGASGGCEKGQTAMPIRGSFDDNAKYQSTEPVIAFACVDKDVTKCVDMGNSPPETAALFQACTRMMRADYCGNGASFTKPNSKVEVWTSNDQMPKLLPGGPSFEAAWNGEGMTCCEHFRWPLEPFVNWRTQAGDFNKYLSCFNKIKDSCVASCDESAQSFQKTGKNLILNQSCVTHPCPGEPTGIVNEPPNTAAFGAVTPAAHTTAQ